MEHKMTNYTEKIINLETGEETIRPFTAEEIAAAEAIVAEREAAKIQREAEQAEKNAARQIILDKLGLSADEVAALLG
jgi:hypothetical protein